MDVVKPQQDQVRYLEISTTISAADVDQFQGYPVADLDGLMREVQAVLDNDSDTEVQQTMRQHYHDRSRGRRPEMRAVLRMTALMVYNWRVGGGRLSPRRALIILALVDWDQALAQFHLEHRQEPEGDREVDGSDEEDGEESEESGSNVS